MKPFKRIMVIVLDSVGAGAAPDAASFNDVGSDTIGHVAHVYHGRLHLPNLQAMGLANLHHGGLEGVSVESQPIGDFGTMQEVSAGKDSMDGHWEMMGLPVKQPLATFPNGFPDELVSKISEFANRKILLNHPYSGTEALRDYGAEQIVTGGLIVYTSGDSVLQIAAHENVVPVAELYRICEYVRTLVNQPPYQIGRVIARPFVGHDAGDFKRTANRRDFSLKPTGETVLTKLQKMSVPVVGIGKVQDIFSGEGIDTAYHNESNDNGMVHLQHVMDTTPNGFVFTNLVDFDAMYGHRRDPIGFGHALMAFDQELGDVLGKMNRDDLIMVTADHGNDPTFHGTDHTREVVPLLSYSPRLIQCGKTLGRRRTFADLGATVLENFGGQLDNGTSFLGELQ